MNLFRVFAALVIAVAGATAAAATEPSDADQLCLTCHSTPGFEKPLANGETLSLHIPGDSFAKSVHAPLGCTACHADVDPASHPPADNPIASRRAFAVARAEVCQTCHSDKAADWSKSVHAALVRNGDASAPLCTSCHAPHAVMKGAAASFDSVPCKTCHSTVFAAYAGSVHGKARGGGFDAAPLCFDCHGAHGVAVPTAGEGMKPVCLTCHTNALAAHQRWLPNAALHFDVVACAACHSPKAKRTVDLVLYNDATQKEVPRPVGLPEFQAQPDAAPGTGLEPQTLVALLKTLNTPGSSGKTSIKGRLTVATPADAHAIVGDGAAISDCNTCHHAGAAAFQSVSISVAGPAGIPIRYHASESVLNSVFSIQSVGGFYAIGATRITVLDILFVLALLGGITIPVVHVGANWWFRHFINGKSRERK